MTPVDADRDCPLAHAVRETLDAVVVPVIREALIHDALTLAGLAALPEEREALRGFAKSYLHAVVARALGAELAESVTDEILLTVQSPSVDSPRAGPGPASGARGMTPRAVRAPASRRSHSPPPTRRSTIGASQTAARSPPPTARATPVVHAPRWRPTPSAGTHTGPWPPGRGSHIRAGSGTDVARALSVIDTVGGVPSSLPGSGAPPLPFVLAATGDPLLLSMLAERLDGRAHVCLVHTLAELVKQLESAGDRRCLVILDGKSPSIRPAAMAVILEDAPQTEVVVCRAEPATEQIILSASPSAKRWLVYREPASLDHVAAECARLVS